MGNRIVILVDLEDCPEKLTAVHAFIFSSGEFLPFSRATLLISYIYFFPVSVDVAQRSPSQLVAELRARLSWLRRAS